MTSTEVAKTDVSSHSLQWSTEQVTLVKRTIAKDCSDDELQLFMHVCKRTGLDPFARQIYAVSRFDSRLGRKVMSIQTGIDGYRLVAQRSNDYAGQEGPFWCGKDGAWKDVWLEKTPPSACRVGVYRKGFIAPLFAVATWSSYCQTKKDGTPMGMWSSIPDVMIAKCAEALALRKAFPQELAGLYTKEEMSGGQSEPQKAIESERPSNLVTDKQRRMLFAKCKEADLAHDYVKAYIKEKFDKDSSKDITKDEFNVLLAEFFPEPKEPEKETEDENELAARFADAPDYPSVD